MSTTPRHIRVACLMAFALSIFAVVPDIYGPFGIAGPACAAAGCLRSVRRVDKSCLLYGMVGLLLSAVSLRLRPNAPPASPFTWFALAMFVYAMIAIVKRPFPIENPT